jgi:hypothetical protein
MHAPTHSPEEMLFHIHSEEQTSFRRKRQPNKSIKIKKK